MANINVKVFLLVLAELYNQYSHAFRSAAFDGSSGDWITCINNQTKLIHCVSTDENSGCLFAMIEDIVCGTIKLV